MHSKRLKQLRQQMTNASIDYYYIPGTDPHRNEYVPPCWQRRAWMTGFTGSAGDALVGIHSAHLWTDGRYFLQAEQQLNSALFQLMKQTSEHLKIEQWLKHASQKKPLRIGFDPQLMTVQQYQAWETCLAPTQSQLIPIVDNFIDLLWENQPALPSSPFFHLEPRYTGDPAHDKLNRLRQTLKKESADAMVITSLDSIAWLFNIRGNDIAYNPLVICYALVTQNQATLFIDSEKITPQNQSYLKSQGILTAPYKSFSKTLNLLKSNTTVLLDPKSTSYSVFKQLKQTHIFLTSSPILQMKAIKNLTEQTGMQEAHRLDGIALVKFLYWIETHWQSGLTEISAAKQLEKFRRETPRCQDLSFPTISGFAGNGAIIHYTPEKKTNKTIDDSALYLVDSGGQYYEGTTDVTRTLHFGQPTSEEKKHYTLVLKGHIALHRSRFPAGTSGEQIDGFARHALWQVGHDYSHGTGHGVGSYLCVHEGPQTISPKGSHTPLEVGMVVSNEPGLYLKNRYGIRIENLCLVSTDEKHTSFYYLKALTLVPYARKLINCRLLNAEEKLWIDDYHHMIYHKLSADLPPAAAQWLKEATKPLISCSNT